MQQTCIQVYCVLGCRKCSGRYDTELHSCPQGARFPLPSTTFPSSMHSKPYPIANENVLSSVKEISDVTCSRGQFPRHLDLCEAIFLGTDPS